jgi:hypothetical protein
MVTGIRNPFNASFTADKYAAFLDDLNHRFPGAIDFRVAETPVFIEKELGRQMIDTCEYIIDFIKTAEFLSLTDRAIPKQEYMRNQNDHSHFIAFDFGICEDENGRHYPALIEMQGFPTLYGFQAYYPAVLEKHFEILQRHQPSILR